MLNKDLKLNEKIFEEPFDQKATRDGFGEALIELGENNPNVVVLTADLAESTRTDGFEKNHPDRFFEIGVAEQNMAAIAAGLAVSGKIPYIASYATFSPGKNLETIRTTIAYNDANVKIAGHHSGVMTGPDGATHQATEDIAITRTWPNMNVLVPCDFEEARKATLESAKINKPIYLRFTRDKSALITTTDTPFNPTKVQTFWVTENPQAVIFATGWLVYFALLAAKKLEEKGVNVLVANVCSIKPLDIETIVNLAKQTKHVVTVEDHQIMGGLGGAIAEVLAKNLPTPMEFVGLNDTFAESGKPLEIIKKYKMDDTAIIAAVEKVITR